MKYGIIGAIIGDVVGSRFEFNNIKHKCFTLFHKSCHYTDDTIMTLAIYDALLNNKNVVDTMKLYYKKYPYRGYGGSFSYWINMKNPEPYNSCGNGAAMRISSVAYMAKNIDEVKSLAYQVTAISHDHPEGLKAAECVAICIYMALHGYNKHDIRELALLYYPEICTLKYKNLLKYYTFTELSQDTVPQAIYCFLISNSFEDCLRTTISIGGDSDTLAAISCAIAGAYYGINNKLINKVKDKLEPEMVKLLFKH